MLLGYPAVVSNPFRIHPESPQHAGRMNLVTEGFQPIREAAAINIPIADCRPPIRLRRRIPTGIDKEDFSTTIGSRVDGVVHLLRRYLELRTDPGFYPRSPAARLRHEHTSP